METIIEGLEGVRVYIDDLVVWGSTPQQHDERLLKLLKRVHLSGLKFNKKKCQFGATEITFLGDKLSGDGVEPDHSKVQAILDMPPPTDKKGVLRAMGMVNILGKFILNLSAKTVCADGDNRKPVAYTSRSMTETERRYAQIEKESLGLVFGCEKFHGYVYGLPTFTAEMDHKPLISIIRKNLNDMSPRIQRMMMKLQRYDLDLVYTPGKYIVLVDALSRAPTPVTTSNPVTTAGQLHVRGCGHACELHCLFPPSVGDDAHADCT
ncbi:hypothetical protein SKAU_G00021290 [Synaphobranchus kaupii]|uniref:ribonuclease H n=1 Tax=Synaphobranchus kaupii TaxID=118154 RepID=A0A9Q1GD45_SYNKA|nr:hypothetical protein SKAU_G00021290 [Synaphobranchus kaupii]